MHDDPSRRYLSLPEARAHFPSNRAGRPVHVHTITGYITRGAATPAGTRVVLRAVRTPGGWKTSPRWIGEFLEELAAAYRPPLPEVAPALGREGDPAAIAGQLLDLEWGTPARPGRGEGAS